MDKKSEGVRKGLAGITFGKKKKAADAPEIGPPTAATVRPRAGSSETGRWQKFDSALSEQRNTHHGESSEEHQSGPPYGKLPPIPPALQLQRWTGASRPPHNWNKLRKDPELWDIHGDTLVFLSRNTQQESRPPPSFRLSSHVLEATRSRFFISILQEGYIDFNSDVESPVNSGAKWPGRPFQNGRNSRHMSPTPENASRDSDGQISYEIYFPAPPGQPKADTLRWHATTRNVFALLYGASFVGIDLFHALKDLQNRLQVYMPPEADNADVIM
jgi:hypothetical protein